MNTMMGKTKHKPPLLCTFVYLCTHWGFSLRPGHDAAFLGVGEAAHVHAAVGVDVHGVGAAAYLVGVVGARRGAGGGTVDVVVCPLFSAPALVVVT